MKYETIIKKAWGIRSKKYGKKIEGVLPKSLNPQINNFLDVWMFEQVARNIKKNSKLKVLDMGCGYGRLSKKLLDKYSDIKINGIDIAKSYVDIYNEDLSPRGKAYQGDIKKLPFKSNSFDIVFLVTSLMYLIEIEDQVKCLQEIKRVLKKGGRFIVIERNPIGHSLITLGGVISLIRGSSNREIPSVSFEKNYLKSLINSHTGKVNSIKGIPFWTISLPIQIILLKISPFLGRKFLDLIYKLDMNSKNFHFFSLYYSYEGSKI